MKRIIFYLFIVTNYFSIGLKSIDNNNLMNLLLTIALLLIGIYVTHSKEMKFIQNLMFYFSVFILYPVVISFVCNADNRSITGGDTNVDFLFICLALAFLVCVIFMVKRYSLAREILWILLLGFSLNKSLFSLYTHVSDYAVSNIVFHGLCYILLISTSKSFKLIKKPKAKKIKDSN